MMTDAPMPPPMATQIKMLVYNGVCLLEQISNDHRKRKGKQCPGWLFCDQIVFIFVHDFLEAPLRLQDAANSQSQFS